MGILGVRGPLGPDVASRQKLSRIGGVGTVFLVDLWSGDDDKITRRGLKETADSSVTEREAT